MDPITVIGLVASITNIVHASKATIRLVNRFKDGDADLRSLSRDLSFFAEALSGFERVLRSRQMTHQASPETIKKILVDASHTMKQLGERLENISALSGSSARRLRWLQQRSVIKKSHDRVKELSSMLQVFLTLAHAETIFAAASQQHVSAIIPPDETDEQATGGAESSYLQVPRLVSRPRRLSDTSSSSRQESETEGSILSLDSLTFVPSISSSTSSKSISSTRTLVDSTAAEGQVYMKRNSGEILVGPYEDTSQAPMVRQACRYSCFCKCHEIEESKIEAKTSRSAQKQKKTNIECTDPSCKANPERRRVPTLEVKPSLLKRISAAMSSNSITVRYDLKTYRMISEGSDAMRYVKHGDLGKLKASIESGEATIWDTAPDGWSLLHTAAYNRQLPIVRYLLGVGVDTDSGDIGARKPADLAILKSIGQDATETEHEMVKVFSQEDDFVRDFEFTPIHVATLHMYPIGDTERPSLQQLIELVDEANNSPPNTNWSEWKRRYTNRSPLFGDILEYFRASAYELPKNAKIVHNLLDQQDKKYFWSPLHWAASAGRVEEMQTLVHYGADPLILSNLNANILHAAVESKLDGGLVGALDIWRRCSDQLDINQQNRWLETPLHVASWCSPACVKLLLEAGAALDVQQEDGQVALHCPGLVRSPESHAIASLLCETNRNDHINVQDVDGRPPLFDFLDHAECVALLIRSGAKLDLVDGCEKTVFHHACAHGESASLQILLENLDDKTVVAAKDLDGNTPLLEALSNGHIACAKLLLNLEDVGDIISTEGWAPVHYAAKIGDRDLLEAVLKHSTFMKGMKTIDGKRAEIIAMEAGNWKGKIKELLREYDYFR